MKKAISFVLILSLVFCFAACVKVDIPETPTNETTTFNSTDLSSAYTSENESTTGVESTSDVPSTSESSTSGENEVTQVPVTGTSETQPQATEAPAPANTTADIVKYLSDAVNKTKAYKANITVNHKEEFNIVEPVVTLDSAEALGSLATKAVNFVKDLVLKPSEEVYSFSGGTATTSEGETTQLLLPKDKAFSLSADNVASASITDENGMKRVKITLKPEETHSLAEVPAVHSNTIGYLDIDGSFKILKIDQIDINYPGSTINALIRPDGYVQSVTYVINLKAYAKSHGMGVSGSADFSGSQTEIWNINW